VAVRVAAIAIVGFFAFTARWPGAGYEALVIAAFAVAVPLIGSWTLAENSPGRGERYEPLPQHGLA